MTEPDVVKDALDEIHQRCHLSTSEPYPCVDFVDTFLRLASMCGCLECQLEGESFISLLVFTADGQEYKYDLSFIFRPCLAAMASVAYQMSASTASPEEFSYYGFEAKVTYIKEGMQPSRLFIITHNSSRYGMPKPYFYFRIKRL